jgi:hypothetical protein
MAHSRYNHKKHPNSGALKGSVGCTCVVRTLYVVEMLESSAHGVDYLRLFGRRDDRVHIRHK